MEHIESNRCPSILRQDLIRAAETGPAGRKL